MANPLPNEKEVYRRIEKEHLTIDPLIWNLLNHHIRNDLNWITMCVGLQRMTPRWILKVGSWVINFLYLISRQPPPPPPDLLETFNGTIERVKLIDNFLRNLEEKTTAKD